MQQNDFPEINLDGIISDIPSLPVHDRKADELAETLKLINTLESLENMSNISGINKWFVPGTPFGIENCHKHKAFFDAGKKYKERTFLAGNRCGKALPLTERVFTENGPATMGDLQVGDKVVGSDGTLVNVTGYWPQGIRPVYKVTTDDGSVLLCDEEHLHTVRQGIAGKKDKWKVLTTKELLNSTDTWFLPQRPAIMYSEADVPVDPYLLGLLIGDGSTSQNYVYITSEDSEIVEYCTNIAKEYECILNKRGKLAYQFSTERLNAFHGNSYNLLRDLLDGLSLRCTSHHKRIPKEYFLTSFDQRVALLQGLMDTDGTCSKNGQATFYSVNKDLCEDVAELVRSLGVSATVLKKNGRYLDQPHTSWLVHIRKTDRFNPFRLKRKAERYLSPSISPRGLKIVSVEFVGMQECACITVDAKDKLFLAGDHILTHNSIAGAYELSCHLTGMYPTWWEGKTFDRPVTAWGVGSTARATRDTVQKELLGAIGARGSGMIPAELIGEFWALSGVPQGVDLVKIKHVPTGGWSTVGFKNYEQPLQAFYGTAMDVIWTDEECPIEIYNELLIRTMTTNGIVYCTYTPLNGLSQQVVRFAEKADYLAGATPLITVGARADDE